VPYIPTPKSIDDFTSAQVTYRRTSERSKGEFLTEWIDSVLEKYPHGIERTRLTDQVGNVHERLLANRFTRWVQLAERAPISLRFAKARTALHETVALRFSVARGVVLEGTTDPTSFDPRDTVTLAIYQYAHSHGSEEPKGDIVDFTGHLTKPVPLYTGYPNGIEDPERVAIIRDLGVQVLRKAVLGDTLQN
jgi:hypothetical protein